MPCRACDGSEGIPLYRASDVPVEHCVAASGPEAARQVPRGALDVELCARCGFIQNNAFDPDVAALAHGYEVSQAASPRFREFASQLCARLEPYGAAAGRRVVEIGCGNGDFLRLLCEHSGARGLGFDPRARSGRIAANVELCDRAYGPHHADLPADLILCRHTLEHLHDVRDFVAMLRRNIGESGTTVCFEVPDVRRILRERAFWDVYYEHSGYFAAESLGHLFRSCGFEIDELRLEYEGQYLLLIAHPGDAVESAPPEVTELVELARAFARDVDARVRGLRAELDALRAADRRMVLWGSGSKAGGYLSALAVSGEIEAVVDVNPAKHGLFQAGAGVEIVAPERLPEIRPDVVMVMNPIYTAEIESELRRLGVEAELRSLQ